MNASGRLIINAVWDDEVRVWVATSDEVPGLATEADDMDALVEKLKKMIPELLDANGVAHSEEVPFEILGKRFAVALTDEFFSFIGDLGCEGCDPTRTGRQKGSS